MVDSAFSGGLAGRAVPAGRGARAGDARPRRAGRHRGSKRREMAECASRRCRCDITGHGGGGEPRVDAGPRRQPGPGQAPGAGARGPGAGAAERTSGPGRGGHGRAVCHSRPRGGRAGGERHRHAASARTGPGALRDAGLRRGGDSPRGTAVFHEARPGQAQGAPGAPHPPVEGRLPGHPGALPPRGRGGQDHRLARDGARRPRLRRGSPQHEAGHNVAPPPGPRLRPPPCNSRGPRRRALHRAPGGVQGPGPARVAAGDPEHRDEHFHWRPVLLHDEPHEPQLLPQRRVHRDGEPLELQGPPGHQVGRRAAALLPGQGAPPADGAPPAAPLAVQVFRLRVRALRRPGRPDAGHPVHLVHAGAGAPPRRPRVYLSA
mmetsp:Transcript_100369/g.284353  ORF Transcript_100369/g.284353 Transcript_100369/m.284353 type:complete len:376 (-) Transcript_100369:11-1138(-)